MQYCTLLLTGTWKTDTHIGLGGEGRWFPSEANTVDIISLILQSTITHINHEGQNKNKTSVIQLLVII